MVSPGEPYLQDIQPQAASLSSTCPAECSRRNAIGQLFWVGLPLICLALTITVAVEIGQSASHEHSGWSAGAIVSFTSIFTMPV